MSQNPSTPQKTGAQVALGIGALGVVFGDIGTSPLYTIRECLASLPPSEHSVAVLGVLSLIVWSLIVVVSVKYTIFVLRADNRGEGGVFALLALGHFDRGVRSGLSMGTLVVLIGAAMLCGEAVITPAITVLGAVEGIKLVDVAKAGAELDGDVTEEKKTEDETKTKSLRERMKSRLGEHVSDVRSSNRLVESPACLVMPEGGLPPHLERMLRASQPGSDKQKRILELNPDHTLIQSLTTLIEKSPSDARIDGFIDLVHAQALLAEGSPPEDPAMLAHKLGELLGDAVSRAAV